MMTRLEFERRSRRLSRAALAVQAEVSEGTIGLLETGEYTPKDETLEKVAYALMISPPAVLLREVKVMPEPEEQEAAAS